MKFNWHASSIAPRIEATQQAVLVLEDGTVFRGRSLGSPSAKPLEKCASTPQ
jgi:hypothetical protein